MCSSDLGRGGRLVRERRGWCGARLSLAQSFSLRSLTALGLLHSATRSGTLPQAQRHTDTQRDTHLIEEGFGMEDIEVHFKGPLALDPLAPPRTLRRSPFLAGPCTAAPRSFSIGIGMLLVVVFVLVFVSVLVLAFV